MDENNSKSTAIVVWGKSTDSSVPDEHRPENLKDNQCRWSSYELVQWIGEGNNGVVYEYKDKDTNESVAVRFATSGSEYYENQLAVYHQFDSIFKPALLCYEPSKLAFMSEYFELRSLEYALNERTFMQRQTIPSKTVQRLASQIVVALHEFHQQGFQHNDLHTGNILIGPTHILLVDFDKSKRVKAVDSVAKDWRFYGQYILRLLYHVDEEKNQFLNKLQRSLQYRPSARNYELITKHPYFEGIDWDKVDLETPLGISIS